MKKLVSLVLVTTMLAACSKKEEKVKTNSKTKIETKQKWVAFPLNHVGYITELNYDLKDNYYRKEIEKVQKEYNFRLDGTANAAYRMKYSTTRAYSTDSPQEYKNAFARLNQNNIGLTFIENGEHFTQLHEAKSGKPEINLWEEIMKRNLYGGHMVMIGKDSQYYLNKEGKVGTGKQKQEWKSNKIATFEFSEIISAYYMGYITQYTFGLTNDGKKKSVGYILGATYEQAPYRTQNIKKAVAFRQGVLDAVKEYETGEATFATKTETSKDKDSQTLVRRATDLEEIIPNLVKSSNYKNKDHSFVYFAGASAEYNELIGSFLKESAVKNALGHNIIGEYASTTSGDLFEASSDTNYLEAITTNDEDEESHVKNKSVTGRIAMFYNSDKKAYRDNKYNREIANTFAITEILKMIYKDDSLDKYFNKHTYVGTFPLVYKPGEQQVPTKAQAAKTIPDDIKQKLQDKHLTEDQFVTKNDFLGWPE